MIVKFLNFIGIIFAIIYVLLGIDIFLQSLQFIFLGFHFNHLIEIGLCISIYIACEIIRFILGFICLPFIDKNELDDEIEYESRFDKLCPHLLPTDFAYKNKILPLYIINNTLALGVIEILEPEILKEIIYLTGLTPKQILISSCDFEELYNKYYVKNETDYISPVLSVPLATIAGLLVTCILGYTFFPALVAHPLYPIIIYAYTLHPLFKYNLNTKRAYQSGWTNFLARLIIGHIIVIPLYFVEMIVSQIQ